MTIDVQWGVRIPLRDAVCLSATVYRPRSSAPAPCLLLLTPYIADTYHDRGIYFASRGLPLVIADVRGRGNSEGTFRPFIHEASDGHDVVEWLAAQPFCDGHVGMLGGSYGGYTQWASAKELPPHLATIVPTAAPFLGVDFPMRNNIFAPYIARWITYVRGHTSQAKLFADDAFWSTIYRCWHESGRSFRDLAGVLGESSAIFEEWLAHPEPDAHWDACNPTAEQYARLQIPILTITGCYDDDQPGALEHYQQHIRHAPPAVRERHYLVIGPWDHLGTGTPRAQFGGMSFGPASLVDLLNLRFEWYAWTMQGQPKPHFLKKRVAYYVMGAESWRYADSLEKITAHYRRWFLDSTRNANDVFHSGTLGNVPGQGAPDGYVYDPRVLDGPEVQAEAKASGGSLVDQSVTLALSGRQLIYHSEPLAGDTEISGFFRLSAWISIDCPDTDVYVSVHEIALDGTSIRLSTDAIRARYREGLRTPRLIASTAPFCYEFNRFTFVSRLVRRGHRLRLVIAPVGRLIEGTFTQKNYNSGGIVADEAVADARPVTVRLFHDQAHPSVLHVPIGRIE